MQLALFHVAQKLAPSLVMVRLNLEDLFAESFYNIMRDKKYFLLFYAKRGCYFFIHCTIVRNIF